ncbi:hypothetical protein LUZ62_044644 [Rhynchospora pubera]|uniref:Phylloplanin-like n=1 Tax=Rhynchospora pubera TaxID=906938 RepID=A0AAV8CEC3_9POAL|nr:hypothetical protein LUZ62_088008 [Rhynchospora pubera]KAJ4793398.1 hypothetical protein LUZ62_044644 [Rhynchospora pubera]
MAVKVYVLLAMLMFAGIVSPIAHAQLIGGIGNLSNTVLSILGLVPCNVGIPFSTSNFFPNAVVQLRCNVTVVASTTTNSIGLFSIQTASPFGQLGDLIGNCNITVATPLVTCNPSLPTTANLASVLTFVNSTIGGLITNLVAVNFTIFEGITN